MTAMNSFSSQSFNCCASAAGTSSVQIISRMDAADLLVVSICVTDLIGRGLPQIL